MTLNAANHTMMLEGSGDVTHIGNPDFILHVKNSHRIITASNESWQPLGVHSSSIAAQITVATAKSYLDDLVANGINAISCMVPQSLFTDNTPTWNNEDGNPPFDSVVPSTSSLDFTDPNSAYWANVDEIINYAATKGIMCGLACCFLGNSFGSEGWATHISDNGTTRMQAYGEWLGNRYKDYPNIFWIIGGDEHPDYGPDLTSHMDSVANGIKTYDKRHLMTAHGKDNNSSLDDYPGKSWLDINLNYSLPWSSICAQIRGDYQETSPLPVVQGETTFGNQDGQTDLGVMRSVYQGILHGGFGHFAGMAPLWGFGCSAMDVVKNDGTYTWQQTVNPGHYGFQYLQYARRLQVARDLPELTPDYAGTFVTAGKGTEGSSYSPVVADSTQLVAFCNQGADLTVDLSQFDGSLTARWFDPTDGSVTTDGGSPYTNSGSNQFTTPDSGDWVLLLDLVSLGLGDP
ncbi:MAG: DUF4038 domain-containing protein [Candidatus Bathyarchaeota archaeon]|jgi:hypothetical protein